MQAGLLAMLLQWSLMGAPDLPVEAPLVPGAVALEERGRYRSARTFQETLDFYRRLFNQTGGVRWRNVVNLPGIKAKHVDSLRNRTRWEGINIYEKQGEVRVYVIRRDVSEIEAPEPKRRGRH